MNDNIVDFHPKEQRKPVKFVDIDWMGIITKDERSLVISDRTDLMKVMVFIQQNNIKLEEVL